MGLTAFFTERRTFAYYLVGLLLIGGTLSFLSLGQLEDPVFTVKKALVVTDYPGAARDHEYVLSSWTISWMAFSIRSVTSSSTSRGAAPG